MRRGLFSKCLAGTLLLWLGLLQFPLPVPVRAPANGKDRTVPFPCMDRPCGCASAEQCWSSCCCTTKDERVAWALRILGEIPETLARSTQNEDRSAPRASRSHASCCQQGGGHVAAKSRSGGGRGQGLSRKNEGRNEVAPSGGRGSVTLTSALKCRGLTAGWTLLTSAVVPAIPDFSVRSLGSLEFRVYSPSLIYTQSCLQPPSPPPRSVVLLRD